MVKQNITANKGEVGVLKKSNVSMEVTGEVTKPGAPESTTSTTPIDIDDFNDDQGINHTKAKISRWGSDNLFPNSLKSLYSNNIVPGLLDFKQDMFFGLGPELYTVKDKWSKLEIADDENVMDWLKSWDYIDFLIAAFADAALQENVFSQYVLNKGKQRISKIYHIDAEECRLSVKDKKEKKSKFIFINDWDNNKDADAKPYNVFDIRKPLETSVTMRHIKKKSSGFRYYALPVFVGMLENWIPLANEIPKFHLSRLQRSLNIKYHIKIPIRSLQQVKEMYKYSQDQLDKWLNGKLKEIDDMLSGAANAGKTFYSFIEHDSNGKEMVGWEIRLIDNNEKEMSEANLQLYNETNQAITSSMQVQPSLASIQLGQKMSSGSEVLNAYNLHIKTRTPIIRRQVLSIINDAIKINWPDKNMFLQITDPVLVPQEEKKSGVIAPTNF